MSQSTSSGMTSAMRPRQTPSLEEMESKHLLHDDQAAPNAASINPAPTAVQAPVPIMVGSAQVRIRRKRVKRPFATRIDDFIYDGLVNYLKQNSSEDMVPMTKESVVNLALLQHLGLTPPEGWEP